MSNIIEIFSLTKRFSTSTNYRALFRLNREENVTAVNEVSLHVRDGELFGLLGANGAGKTTLIKMLCTLILPTEGRATIAGKDIVSDADAVRRQIGLIDTNERSFFWRLTGRQNLEFFAALYGLNRPQATRRIDELLTLVNMKQHADRRFSDYSTGMRQKMAIVRGLLVSPQVIFLDEPTRSLDPVSAYDLRRFVQGVLVEQMGRTIVLVTHRLEEAESMCKRVAIMTHGRVVACGPVAEIKQKISARQQYQLRVCNLSSTTIKQLQHITGLTQVESNLLEDETFQLNLTMVDENESLPLVFETLVKGGAQVQACQAKTVSLEDAFVTLVKNNAR
ncbi:ABC transporter ATP-binding protein [Anaerolineales bacterium HSG24]|nr:ABC transporter ATP-binding protein [Anaerolineales bacterium HSG24]